MATQVGFKIKKKKAIQSCQFTSLRKVSHLVADALLLLWKMSDAISSIPSHAPLITYLTTVITPCLELNAL
jgi:hypothetical protein